MEPLLICHMLFSMPMQRSGSITSEELKWALQDFGIELTRDELAHFTEYFGVTADRLSYEAMLSEFRGEFNDERCTVVEAAFKKLSDAAGRDVIAVASLCDKYDCSLLPDYKDGSKSRAEVIADFKKQLHPADVLSRERFVGYYRYVS